MQTSRSAYKMTSSLHHPILLIILTLQCMCKRSFRLALKFNRKKLKNNMNAFYLPVSSLLAAIEPVDPHNVPVGHALSLADLDIGVWDGGDGVLPPLVGEGCFFNSA